MASPANLVELLRSRADREVSAARGGGGTPAYLFLSDGETEAERLSYAELDLRARAIGAALAAAGAAGERVLLLFPPGLEFVASFFGCLYAGAVAVPSYPPRPNRPQPRLRSIAADCAPRAVLTTSSVLDVRAGIVEHVPELAAAAWLAADAIADATADAWRAPALAPDDLAFLQYTSGSTAAPKGVMVSHGNLLANEELIRRAFGQSAESVIVGWLPLYHDMGLIGNVLQPLYVGGRCILMSPLSFLQRPTRWLEAIDRYRATTSGGPNFAYELLLKKAGDELLDRLDLSSWTLAFNGAEPVRAETLERFAARFARCGFEREALFPCYGLAEATLFVAGGEAGRAPVLRGFEPAALEQGQALPSAAGRSLVGCGRSFGEHAIAVVDPESRVPLAAGRVGEIWVAGASVARGYWRNPETTGETFGVALAVDDGRRYLRTGDLGFVVDEGGAAELFVTGRIKDLIIVRGRNHYPQDLELTAERSHAALKAGGGAAFSIERDGEERLAIVHELERGRQADAAAAAEALRGAIAREHEVQVEEVALIRVGTLPKTSSGKVQRRLTRQLLVDGGLEVVFAERAGDAAGPARGTDDEAAPGAGVERGDAFAGPLRALLVAQGFPEAARLPLDRPLASLGLDSLAAVELKFRCEESFGVELPLADLLGELTLGELSELAASSRAGAEPAGAERRDADRRDEADPATFPLSAGQAGLYVQERLAPGSYNLAAAFELESVDPASEPTPDPGIERLAQALAALAARHPALRTTLDADDVDGASQTVHARLPIGRRAIDLGDGAAEDAVAAALLDAAYRPFDLAREAPLRLAVVRRGVRPPLLVLVAHHTAVDFRAVATLLGELRGPAALGPGESPPPRGASVARFVRWQRAWLASADGERAAGAWLERLAPGGAPGRQENPSLDLPLDRPRPERPSGRTRSARLALDRGRAAALAAVARGAGGTLFSVLAAAFRTLLHRLSGQTSVRIGTPALGRTRPEFRDTVGYLVNPIVLAGDLDPEASIGDLLAREVREARSALDLQAYPFPLLAERLDPIRDGGRAALFQAMLVLHRGSDETATLALGAAGVPVRLAGLDLRTIALPEGRSELDLTLTAVASGDANGERLDLALAWPLDLVDPATGARWLDLLEAILATLADAPATPLAALSGLAGARRQQVLVEWNERAGARALAADECEGLLHGRFARWAAAAPEAVALVGPAGERVRYGELLAYARRLGRWLNARGVGPEVRVGVLAPRTPRLVAALLGVLEAGGAYVPLDPAYPSARLAFMVEDSGARLVLVDGVDESVADRLAGFTGEVVRLAAIEGELAALPSASLPPLANPHHLSHLIYTSGSTGRPKGVAIEHRSGAALLDWAGETFVGDDGAVGRRLDRMLAATSVCFDLSVFEIFAPLSFGGRVILAENVLAMSAHPAHPARDEVRFVNTVPSAMAELLAAGHLPGSVRTLGLAGEALPGWLAHDLSAAGVAEVWNLYGPSEDTTYSTFWRVRSGEERPAIGRPLPGSRAYVVDRGGRPVPAGAVGEIVLGGVGLARGYLGRPELTAERFVPDGVSGSLAPAGARLYRTGDLGRQRPDGALEYLGRIDQQIKLRGFRIELGEVEGALRAEPRVREAAVAVDRASQRLVGYVVGRDGDFPANADEARALERALAERLTEAMVPTAWMPLPALPRLPNGKIDRQALTALTALTAPAAAVTETQDEALRTPTEELLAAIWSEVLETSVASRAADFFALGGHSLLAVRVAARVRALFGVELSLPRLLERTTLGRLAEEIDRLRSACAPIAGPVPLAAGAPERLSLAERRLYFLDRLRGGAIEYDLPFGLRLRGALDGANLGRAFARVVARHDVLRRAIPEVAGEPSPRVLPAAAAARLPRVDLSALAALGGAADPESDRVAQREAERIARGEGRRPFDLARGPLVRAALVRLAVDDHLFAVVCHHLAFDGGSLPVFLADLATFARGEEPPPLALRYREVAAWSDARPVDVDLDYWAARLAGLAPLDVALDRPRPTAPRGNGGLVSFAIDGATWERLVALGRALGATPFLLALAALETLLHRVTGEDRVAVGAPVAGRDAVESEGLIGLFVNPIVLDADLSGDPTFSALVARLRGPFLDAFDHRGAPFERVIERLAPARDLGRNPLFSVSLSLEEAPTPPRLPGVEAEIAAIHNGTAKLDLAWTLWRLDRLAGGASAGLAGSLEWSADLYDAATASRLARAFATLLEGVAERAERRLSALPILSPAERAAAIAESAAPALAALPVLARIAGFAAAAPGAIAVVDGAAHLSRGELARRSGRLARTIRARISTEGEPLVAVCAERSADLVAALLAIRRAGAAYVPLDPASPAERLAALLADLAAAGSPPLLLIDANGPSIEALGRAGWSGEAMLLDLGALGAGAGVEGEGEDSGARPVVSIDAESDDPDWLAYAIFTSGSTGRPKATAISGGALDNLVAWHLAAHAIGPDDRLTLVANPAFDASTWEIWAALGAGAALLVAPERARLSGAEMLAWLAREQATSCFLPTPLAEACLEALREGEGGAGAAGPPALRSLLTGGDRLRSAPGPEARFALCNQYGPTECAVVATWGEVAAEAGGAPPIGRPISGLAALVVDRSGEIAMPGAPGELWLGGAGVGRGYLGRPDLTAERFVPDPFTDPLGAPGARPGARLYRTGDLVRRRRDGQLEFLGRIDRQVKVRGVRIEPGEVEAALAAHPNVRDAIVDAVASPGSAERRLVAWVVPAAGWTLDVDELARFLKSRLPESYVPTQFAALVEVPLTPNGKVDRAALPAIDAAPREYVAPDGEVEEILAGLFAEVLGEALGARRVGATDGFFELGGHSLQGMRLLARVREELGVDLPPRTLFEAPTVAGLALAVVDALLAESADDDVREALAEIGER